MRTWSRDATIKKYLGSVGDKVNFDDLAELCLGSVRAATALVEDCGTIEDLCLGRVAFDDGRRLLRSVRDDIVFGCYSGCIK